MNNNLPENPYFNWEEKVKNFNNYEYDLSFFGDRMVQYPWQFLSEDKGSYTDLETGKTLPIVQLIHFEGEIIEPGTPLSEKYLGNMDIALKALFNFKAWAIQQMLEISLKSGALEDSMLNGLIANAYTVTFTDLADGDIKINKGYWKKATGEVWG